MRKSVFTLALVFSLIALVLVGVLGGDTTATSNGGVTLMVANKTTYSSISFGYNSYKVVNGSSTRQGSGATTSIGTTGVFKEWPVLGSGDELYLDKGLKITSPDRYMNSDGSDTCGPSGFGQGVSSLFGRGYLQDGDSFTVTVTREQGVIPGIYTAVCVYSR